MKRVLQVLGRSAGGVARHVAVISGQLHTPRSLEIDVAGPPGGPIAIPRHRHEVLIPDGPLFGHRKAVGELTRVVRAGRYDLVHAHGLRASIDCAFACRRAGIPLYMSMHNLIRADIAGSIKSRLYRWGESFAVRSSVRTFAPSAEIARHLRATVKVDPQRVEVLYLGVGEPAAPVRSRANVRSDWRVEPETPVVITVARLAPQKALHILLEGIALLPETHLVVVGDGPLEAELRDRATSLGVDTRVTWAGFRDDVQDQLRAADVFCITSLWEAVSLAVQEAVLLEIPVVASDVGGITELIEPGKGGLLVPKNDVGALVEALGQCLADPGAAKERAIAAKTVLRERFSTEKMLARLRAAYLEPTTPHAANQETGRP
jgi:glycosyltransferase involved in cell wall biosynthesis